ncbi:MAG TPA: ATP-binding protein [Rectinemataceae bacterium]|nr:ATP-binding protein [Rectinemataceae bacterium]
MSPEPERASETGSAWITIRHALEGDLPPWLERFLSTVGRAIHRHQMIPEGEAVLVGVSGGKDSLACAVALALRRRRLRSPYRLHAALVDWSDAPCRGEEIAALAELFALLSVPFSVIPGRHRSVAGRWEPETVALSMTGESAQASAGYGCYSCARERKRLIFQEARRLGCSRVAFGHHLDDFVGTALMNLCFRGRLEPMEPLRSFFGGEISLIRPLCELPESKIRTLAERLELPVVPSRCPQAGRNLRDRLKPLVADLAKMDKLVREKVYRAWFGDPRREEAGWTSET